MPIKNIMMVVSKNKTIFFTWILRNTLVLMINFFKYIFKFYIRQGPIKLFLSAYIQKLTKVAKK